MDCLRAESQGDPEDQRPDLPGPNLRERQGGGRDGTRRGAREQGSRGGAGGRPAASPDTAGRKRAFLGTARTAETHPTRGHTRRAEATVTSEDSPFKGRQSGRRTWASSRWRKLPRPPQLTPHAGLVQPPQRLASGAHAPPGLDGPISGRCRGGRASARRPGGA